MPARAWGAENLTELERAEKILNAGTDQMGGEQRTDLVLELVEKGYDLSDRRVDQPAHVDPVTREAYSHEVISSGFWFGNAHVPEPAFYSYTAPEPVGLTEEPLRTAASLAFVRLNFASAGEQVTP